MNAGSTFRLSDGTYLGITNIFARDITGSVGTVDFFLGVGKLEIDNGRSIKFNDRSYSDVVGYIRKGTSNDGKESIDYITFQWRSTDEAFIGPRNDLEMPGLGLKFSMGPFITSAQEETLITNDGSYVLQLQTTINDGDVTIPLLYTNASGAFLGLGKGPSNRLVTSNQSGNANRLYNYTGGDRMMVVTFNSSTHGQSYLLRFNAYSAEDSANRTTVEYYANGGWVSKGDKKGGDTVTLDGNTLIIGDVYIIFKS